MQWGRNRQAATKNEEPNDQTQGMKNDESDGEAERQLIFHKSLGYDLPDRVIVASNQYRQKFVFLQQSCSKSNNVLILNFCVSHSKGRRRSYKINLPSQNQS